MKQLQIVWDQDKKRWVNVDEDPNDPSNEFKPPPKMSDMMPKMGNSGPPQQNVPTYNVGQTDRPASVPTGVVQTNVNSARSVAADDGTSALKPGQPNMFKLQRGRSKLICL